MAATRQEPWETMFEKSDINYCTTWTFDTGRPF